MRTNSHSGKAPRRELIRTRLTQQFDGLLTVRNGSPTLSLQYDSRNLLAMSEVLCRPAGNLAERVHP